MASIYILNKVCKGLAPNTFKKAIVNTDIIVGGISKLVVEHTLLKTEMSIYNGVFMSPLFIPSFADTFPPIVMPFVFTALITLPVIYCVPAYRTYKAIVNKNLQIINFSSE